MQFSDADYGIISTALRKVKGNFSKKIVKKVDKLRIVRYNIFWNRFHTLPNGKFSKTPRNFDKGRLTTYEKAKDF